MRPRIPEKWQYDPLYLLILGHILRSFFICNAHADVNKLDVIWPYSNNWTWTAETNSTNQNSSKIILVTPTQSSIKEKISSNRNLRNDSKFSKCPKIQFFSDNPQTRCKYYFGMPDTDITKIKSWNYVPISATYAICFISIRLTHGVSSLAMYQYSLSLFSWSAKWLGIYFLTSEAWVDRDLLHNTSLS